MTFDTNFESQFPQDFDFILGPFWLHRGPHPDIAREADPDLANFSESLPSQTQLGRQIQTWGDFSDVARHRQTTHRDPSQFPQDFDPILNPFWLHREPHPDLAREADPDLANLSESLPSQTQLGRQIQTWRDLSDVARHSQTTHRDPARFSQASFNPARFDTNFESEFPPDFSPILTPF